MITKLDKNKDRIQRHKRVREKIFGTAARPRLCVKRSLTGIYAQIINDENGTTLVAASTLEKELAAKVKGKTKTEASEIVGEAIAKRAVAKKIKLVVFDRGGYIYTGRVKAFADAARKAGLEF